jgi:hypothetical protein
LRVRLGEILPQGVERRQRAPLRQQPRHVLALDCRLRRPVLLLRLGEQPREYLRRPSVLIRPGVRGRGRRPAAAADRVRPERVAARRRRQLEVQRVGHPTGGLREEAVGRRRGVQERRLNLVRRASVLEALVGGGSQEEELAGGWDRVEGVAVRQSRVVVLRPAAVVVLENVFHPGHALLLLLVYLSEQENAIVSDSEHKPRSQPAKACSEARSPE